MVVDFGTAINFDAVSAAGEFIGGAIAPGLEVAVNALGARAARLFGIELAAPRAAIGKNTAENMQSGRHLRLRRAGRRPRHGASPRSSAATSA